MHVGSVRAVCVVCVCVTRAMCEQWVRNGRAMGVRGAECVGVCVLGVRWVCKGHAGRRARVVHGVSVCVCVCHVSR